MKMYHLALILIVLAMLLGFIAMQMGMALRARRTRADAYPPDGTHKSSTRLPTEQPPLADNAHLSAPRTRQRILKRASAGGEAKLSQQFLESDIFGQLERNLERAFESYAIGRTTLSRYRKTVAAERLAMIRHLDEINNGRPTADGERSQAEAALAAIDWCLAWADDIERRECSDGDGAKRACSADPKLQDAA